MTCNFNFVFKKMHYCNISPFMYIHTGTRYIFKSSKWQFLIVIIIQFSFRTILREFTTSEFLFKCIKNFIYLFIYLFGQSTIDASTPKRMDIANSGLCSIPEVVLKGIDTIEELSAGQNQLQEIALTALSNFRNLKVLHLGKNGFKKFPEPLLECKGLVMLDLVDNGIEVLPERICVLKK